MSLPKEYTDLTAAISNVFFACGSKEVCGACFAGKLREEYGYGRSHGCCSRCSSLTPTGCALKPLSCALWECAYMSRLLPLKTRQILRAVRDRLPKWSNGFRTLDFEDYTQEDLVYIANISRILNRYAIRLQRTHKIDWKDIAKFTHADPGTFQTGA